MIECTATTRTRPRERQSFRQKLASRPALVTNQIKFANSGRATCTSARPARGINVRGSSAVIVGGKSHPDGLASSHCDCAGLDYVAAVVIDAAWW